jgi:uncharacterized protein (DUF305 family)
MIRSLLLGTALAAGLGVGAFAQQGQGQTQSGQMQAMGNLPEACRDVVQAGIKGDVMQTMQQMHGRMSQQMQGEMQGMLGQMNETQKGLHEAMMNMNGPMMMGMLAKDADVAWICAMIPHHQGAIDMARAGLKRADNDESRKLAEKTISENEKSLKELTAWVQKHAQNESKNEMTGSTR